MKFNNSSNFFNSKDSNIIKSNKKSDNKNSVKDKSEVNSGRGIFFSKEKVLFVVGLVMMVFSSCISVFAASFLYNSNEVSFNNSSSPSISSNNVQGAIDELYSAASDYSALQSRVAALEGRWKNGAESFFEINNNEEWLRIKNSNLNNRGVAVQDNNNKSRGLFYYAASNAMTYLVSNNSSGTWGQGTLNLAGNPVMVNGTSIGDYYKITTTRHSTTLKAALNSHSGGTFANQLTARPSITVPSGYTLVSNVYIEATGQTGVSAIFDSNSNITLTSNLNGYLFNASNNNYTSGSSIQLNIISLWKKS